MAARLAGHSPSRDRARRCHGRRRPERVGRADRRGGRRQAGSGLGPGTAQRQPSGGRLDRALRGPPPARDRRHFTSRHHGHPSSPRSRRRREWADDREAGRLSRHGNW
ncbi:hypothetical protein C7I55_07610 [Sphingomonas deserti]|uniref:Uncharacterized protein n=1 Tax=Allosphingosinicella deserti TaxID=2116704 RepID=A0A2P7QVV9_9SPHN|nr:hypothetical protein C7I55_07610 [Sphingomonas deserti]